MYNFRISIVYIYYIFSMICFDVDVCVEFFLIEIIICFYNCFSWRRFYIYIGIGVNYIGNMVDVYNINFRIIYCKFSSLFDNFVC